MNYPYYSQNYSQMPQSTFVPGRPTFMDVMQQSTPYPGIKGRPVASFDEAKVSMIDFDGSIFYFPDTANQRIYTKQINLDGTSSLKTYVLAPDSVPAQTPTTLDPSDGTMLVTKKEFEATINSLMNEISALKGAINRNDEPTVANANDNAAAYDFK